MKFVGIDFGHGEISASYINGSGDVKQLKLVNTVDNVVDKWKIPSYLYQYKDSNSGLFVYSLEKPREAHSLLSELKKPISYMTEDEKEHYKALIQLIVQRLRECNSELSEGFELAIACPTKWLDYQKEEYKQFFNEALSDSGIQIYAIMNESDAAFFAKYKKKEDHNKNILVVDYGSSTIDFTLVSNGKKADLDVMSSSNLGASAIEKAVLATNATDKDSNYAYVHQIVDPILRENELEWIEIDNFIRAQIRKKKEQMFTAREQYLEEFGFAPYTNTALNELRRPDLRFRYELSDPLLEVNDIQDYVKKVEAQILQLKEKVEHDGHIDKVIMSGGACMMKWVQDLVARIFDTATIEIDRFPAFVVCDGIVKYCQKYQECIDRLREEVDNINIKKILEDTDNDTINAISSDYIKEAIMTWQNDLDSPSIDNLIYQRIPSVFINNFNAGNAVFNNKYNALMTSKINSQIKKSVALIIKDVFGIEIYIDSFPFEYSEGAKYGYPEYCVNPDTKEKISTRLIIYKYLQQFFEDRDSFWSFTSFLDLPPYDISYSKPRYSGERNEIAKCLLDNFSQLFYNFDEKAHFKFPSLENDEINRYKGLIFTFALQLMEEKQLFKTSFSR